MLYEVTAGYGIIMVLVVQMIAIGLTVVLGGFKIGDLKKAVQLTIAKADVNTFWGRMHQRLLELGFRQSEIEGRFLQGGAEFGNPTSFTHGKTSKMLSVQFQDAGADQTTVTATLRYLDPIVGDTGESAYRDAVLDYVTGKTDGMVLVPNRSLFSMNSLIGGVMSLSLVIVLAIFNIRQLWEGWLVLTITEIVVGLLAIFVVLRKRGEITGMWLAISGMSLSVIALAIALVVKYTDLTVTIAH